jgi:hypothetical protein
MILTSHSSAKYETSRLPFYAFGSNRNGVNQEVPVEDTILVAGLTQDSAVNQIFMQDNFNNKKRNPIYGDIPGNMPDTFDIEMNIILDFFDTHADHLLTPDAVHNYLRLMAVLDCLRLRRELRQTAVKDFSPAYLNVEVVVLLPDSRHVCSFVTLKDQKALQLNMSSRFPTSKPVNALEVPVSTSVA